MYLSHLLLPIKLFNLIRLASASRCYSKVCPALPLAFVPPNKGGHPSASAAASASSYSYSSSSLLKMVVTMDSPSAHRNKEPIFSILNSKIIPSILQSQSQQQSNDNDNDNHEKSLRVLEVAAGCGVHTTYFANQIYNAHQQKNQHENVKMNLQWYPTDPDGPSLSSCKERVDEFHIHQEKNGNKDSNILIAEPFSLTLGENGALEDVVVGNDGDEMDKNTITNTITTHVGSQPLNLIICINMIHISPWSATIGLFKIASEHLQKGNIDNDNGNNGNGNGNGVLMTYGPYKQNGTAAESNLRFDASLKSRNDEWGVRDLEKVEQVAKDYGMILEEIYEMPANNLLLVWKPNGE